MLFKNYIFYIIQCLIFLPFNIIYFTSFYFNLLIFFQISLIIKYAKFFSISHLFT